MHKINGTDGRQRCVEVIQAVLQDRPMVIATRVEIDKPNPSSRLEVMQAARRDERKPGFPRERRLPERPETLSQNGPSSPKARVATTLR